MVYSIMRNAPFHVYLTGRTCRHLRGALVILLTRVTVASMQLSRILVSLSQISPFGPFLGIVFLSDPL